MMAYPNRILLEQAQLRLQAQPYQSLLSLFGMSVSNDQGPKNAFHSPKSNLFNFKSESIN
jgi:hypothetical protein